MKKILSLIGAMTFSIFAFATTIVTMDFANPADYGYAVPEAGKFTQLADGYTLAKDNVKLIVNFASGSGFRFYNSNGKINLRGYINSKLSIVAPEGKKLLKISAKGANMTSDYLSGDMTSAKWQGEADAVVLNIIKSTVQINTMTIEYGDAGETPTITTIDTIGVSQAIALINAGDKNEYYIKGVVAGDPFMLGSLGPAFYLTDINNPTDSLEGYKIDKNENTKYNDVAEMEADFDMGDTILIYASGLDRYNTIYETTGGYFCKILGKYAAVVLDWTIGSAYLEENGWRLDIQKADKDDKNIAKFKIASDKKDAIAGSYQIGAGSSLILDGSNSAITAGSIQLTFIKVGTTDQNEYQVRAIFSIGDQIYRVKKDIPFFAYDAEGNDIVLKGDRPFVPTEGQEITCAQAKEYTLSLASGATSDITVTVVGYVTELFSNGKTFWMDDEKGTKKTIQAYMFKTLTPANKELQNGAKVKVTGKITNYNGNTPEIKDGVVEIIEGGKDIVATEATVAEALAAAKALEQNKTSDVTYAITGYISDIVEEFKADKGNMSFWMADNLGEHPQEFRAFRVTCTVELAAQLFPGAKVKVTAKVTHFYQAGKPATEYSEAKPECTFYETVQGGAVEIIEGVDIPLIEINVSCPTEQGRVTGNGSYYYLSSCVIEAYPYYGYHFVNWNDGNTDNPRTITVTKNETFTATFAKNVYTITKVANSSQGHISGPSQAEYLDQVTIQAEPEYGYHFTQWSDGNKTNPRSFELTCDTTFTAEFAPNQYTLTLQCNNEQGFVEGEGVFDYQAQPQISATPAYGYHFSSWSDGNTDNPRKYTVTKDVTLTANFAPNIYLISISCNSEQGQVTGNGSYTYLSNRSIEAIANYGYHFAKWSDGNTSNPRTIELRQDTAFVAIFAIDKSGTCGDNLLLTWQYDSSNQILTISGEGDLTANKRYGVEAIGEMRELIIEDGVGILGDDAFANIKTLKSVSLGKDVRKLQERVFYNCYNLEAIYSYRRTPASALTNTFEEVDKYACTVYVMAGSEDMFRSATGWKDFYTIRAIGASETTVTNEEVMVAPTETTAAVTWPAVENAATYELVIKDKSGNVVCTLIFNANGQLTEIAFAAPGRSQRSGQIAGFSFTVTGLDSGTGYDLTINAKDSQGEVINTTTQSFTTVSNVTTGVDATLNASPVRKQLIDGVLYILRDGKTYTAQGQEVK